MKLLICLSAVSFLLASCKQPQPKTSLASTVSDTDEGNKTSATNCAQIDAAKDADGYIACVSKSLDEKSCKGEDCDEEEDKDEETSKSSSKEDDEDEDDSGSAPSCAAEGKKLSKPAKKTSLKDINVRSDASTSGNVVGTIGNGDTVTAYSSESSGSYAPWYCIKTSDGTSGWAASNGDEWFE